MCGNGGEHGFNVQREIGAQIHAHVLQAENVGDHAVHHETRRGREDGMPCPAKGHGDDLDEFVRAVAEHDRQGGIKGEHFAQLFGECGIVRQRIAVHGHIFQRLEP